MKKIIAILLVFVLIVPMCIISASADENEELTFRGIKFGTNYDEVKRRILEDIGECKIDGTIGGGDNRYYLTLKPDNLKVAGYNVYSIKLLFHFTDVGHNLKNSIFTQAEYCFRPTPSSSVSSLKDIVTEDITTKLSKLYGDYTKRSNEKKYYWVKINDNPEVTDSILSNIFLGMDEMSPENLTKKIDKRVNAEVIYYPYSRNDFTYSGFEFNIIYASISSILRAGDLLDNAAAKAIQDSSNNSDGL